MKLFIPTSSLNFNNIMSSESISPYNFYLKRNFGYKVFEKVNLNSLNNSLLLYEVFPEFRIPKSELVNYPMVIEVDIDSEMDGLKNLQNGIWQIDKTVYLNPFSSRIYFNSFEEIRTSISRSESSVETKLVKLYLNCIEVHQSEKKEYSLKDISDLKTLNLQEIENDNQKNKIKGFAYAYLIAANNSIAREDVHLLNLINKTTNLSSAIVNSVSGTGSLQQNDELKNILRKINEYQYHEVKDYLKTVLPVQYNEVWNIIYHQFGMRIHNKFNFEIYVNSLTDKIKYEVAIQELKTWSNKVIQCHKSNQPKMSWNNIAIAGNRLTQYEDIFAIKPESKGMYQNLINDLFVTSDITESTFSAERSRLADEITRKIKSYVGEEEWRNHDANKYLNSLRRNIAGQEAFNYNWNTGLISAIASFLLKGEDFEKLNDFLISSEIEDGRLAFGFYGSICGFANLSRVFTASFFESNFDYLANIYKALYKQLHNVELPGDLPKERKSGKIPMDLKVNSEKKQDNNDITKIVKELEADVPDFSNLKERDKLFYKNEMSKLYKGNFSEAFIKSLEQIENPKGTIGKWKSVLTYFKNKYKPAEVVKQIKNPNAKQTSMSFSKSDSQLFFQDDTVFENISSLIPNSELKNVKSEIDWIQKVHRENGYEKRDGTWVNLEKHSNEEVINHLRNNAIRQGKITTATLNIIIGELNRRYSN